MKPIYKRLNREYKSQQWWILYHLICVSFLITSVVYTYKIFKTHDNVILLDKSGNLYKASTRSIQNKKIIRDIAERATYAFLNRTYETDANEHVEPYFLKKGRANVRKYMSLEKEDFKQKQIRQIATIEKIKMYDVNGFPTFKMVGTLKRHLTFEKEVNFEKKYRFVINCVMIRSPDVKDFPYKVARFKYKILKEITEKEHNER